MEGRSIGTGILVSLMQVFNVNKPTRGGGKEGNLVITQNL